MPEAPTPFTAQSIGTFDPTVLASAEPQTRYVTESIERLRIGDMVLAMDPATGEIGHHRVVDHFQRTAYELRVLEFIGSDAKRHRIETTDEHPFFVLSEGDFIPAAELQIGDQCPGPQGEIQTLVATRLEPRPEGVPVFNFEVQHAHTYYVQAEDLQGPPLLVHNANGGVCGPHTPIKIKGRRVYALLPDSRGGNYRSWQWMNRATGTQGHHPLAKFLGGDKLQTLSRLPPNVHREFHSLLRANLKDAGIPLRVGGRAGSATHWRRYMQQNPGAQRKGFDAILDASRAIDAKYGTSITRDVWNSIMGGKFTPYP